MPGNGAVEVLALAVRSSECVQVLNRTVAPEGTPFRFGSHMDLATVGCGSSARSC
jgi:hypothetical protein